MTNQNEYDKQATEFLSRNAGPGIGTEPVLLMRITKKTNTMEMTPIPTKEKCDLNKGCPEFSHFICSGYIHIKTPKGILSLQGRSLDDLNAHRVSLEAEIERLRRRLENVNRVLFGESISDPRALKFN